MLALEVIEHVAQPAAFLADALSLVAPGGLLVLSTLNRTWRSLALAKVAAEHLLRWAPPGTHDWRRFLGPAEVLRMAMPGWQALSGPEGLTYSPIGGRWRRSSDLSINYIVALVRAESGKPVASPQQVADKAADRGSYAPSDGLIRLDNDTAVIMKAKSLVMV